MQVQVVDSNGVVVGVLSLTQRTFSTGSRGYGANGKVVIDGKRHQVSLNVVEIGSRPQ